MTKKKEYIYPLLAFSLPVGLMLILFIINGIYPFGGKCFLTGDLWHQYMPFFSEFLHKVRGGESLEFSFNLGIGSNFKALYVYYLASPFHFLALLLPEKFLIEFIGYLIVLKTGLCGLTANKYLQERFGVQDMSTVLFSLFYAFCGFMAAYDYNIMWVDCVWVLPLILLGLERLVKEGRYALYCLALAYSIYTNFYLSIMICMFLVLYFGYLFITNSGRRLKSIGMFAVFSLLAGAMASVLLVPEVCALLETDFGDVTFPDKIKSYFSVLEVLARHFVCVSTEKGLDHWPNIYCGSAVLMMIPMYLMNKKISIREKFCKMGLAMFLLLSFSTNVLDFIWHGFNYPDSLPARQSFLYCFLIVTMCYDAFHRMKEAEPQQILYGYLLAAGFVLYCERTIDHEDFQQGVKLATLLFVTAYAVLLYLYRTRKTKFARLMILLFATILVLTECGVNMGVTSIPVTTRASYLAHQEDYKLLYEKVREREEGFTRVEKFTRKTKNDGTLTGYPTASIFSSTMNSQVMDLFTRLGMRHSKVYYGYDGATMFTAALLNVGYMFGESDRYEGPMYSLVEESNDIYLYESNYKLPFGYVLPAGYDLPEGMKNQSPGLQNKMVNELGVNGDLLKREKKFSSTESAEFVAKTDGTYYAHLTASGTRKVTMSKEGEEDITFNDLKIDCILYLGYLEKEESITLVNGDEDDTTPKFSVDIYSINEEVLKQVTEQLSETHLTQVEAESDKISGHIDMQKAGRLVLSVPAEAGWKVLINGEEVQSELFGGCLMAFDLEPGSYDISMTYRAKGSTAGWLISLAGIAGFLGILLLDHKKKHPKQNKKEQEVPSLEQIEDEGEEKHE
ncbi:MAG: YfhO family protein [Acetatifactor sp.]|nr:YfhO family protein [Acetatifactor sp.]